MARIPPFQGGEEGSKPSGATKYNISMDEWNREIEKYWRDKFADEIMECLIGLDDDESTMWFNRGMEHAARIVRYARDDK